MESPDATIALDKADDHEDHELLVDEFAATTAASFQSLVQDKLFWITVFEAIAVSVFTFYLIRRFSARSNSWWVLLCVYFGWIIGFSSILLLPLDIAFTQSNDHVSSRTLIRFWEISFWSTTVMAYVIFPLLKGIVASGSFTCTGKIRQSACRNLMFYVGVVVVTSIALIWVWASDLPLNAFVGFVMALSNIYGLLLITVLLSFGLVDVPRYLWLKSDYQKQLRCLQLQATACEATAFESDVQVQNVHLDVEDAVRKIRDSAAVNKTHRVSAEEAESISLQEMASELVRQTKQHQTQLKLKSSEIDSNTIQLTGNLSRDQRALEHMHERLLQAQMQSQQAHAQWDALVQKAVHLSALVAFSSGYDEGSPSTTYIAKGLCGRLAQYWDIYLAPWFFKLAAIVAAILSTLLVWSELTIAVPIPLSPLGYVIEALEEDGDVALLQVAALVPLLYMTFATHRSLVQLKLPCVHADHMHDGQQTGAYALLFNATYVCTLQFTIGFNYLMLLQLNEWSATEFAVPDCAFKNVTGTMDVLPVLGSSFFVFFPVIMALFVVIFAFQLHRRALRLCGVVQDTTAAYGVLGTVGGEGDSGLAEGITLIQEHKAFLDAKQTRDMTKNGTTSDRV